MEKRQRNSIASFGIVLSIISLVFGLRSKPPPGFAIEKIRSPFEYSSKWEIDNISPKRKAEVSDILQQDFNYLGSGAQCYAFLSADGKYVLKFFKIKHLVPKKWLNLLPLPGLEKIRFNKIDKRISRHHQLFASYKMAYDKLREETGLIYIHLNKSKDLKLRAKLYDRLRNCFVVNLDEYEFIVQEKAQLIRDRITAHVQRGEREEAVACIRSLLQHGINQCKKGFIDRDSGVSHNYGFVGNRIIHFDVGRITQDEVAKEPSYYHHEILRIGKKLENWLALEHPMLLSDLEEVIDSLISPSTEEEESSSQTGS